MVPLFHSHPDPQLILQAFGHSMSQPFCPLVFAQHLWSGSRCMWARVHVRYLTHLPHCCSCQQWWVLFAFMLGWYRARILDELSFSPCTGEEWPSEPSLTPSRVSLSCNRQGRTTLHFASPIATTNTTNPTTSTSVASTRGARLHKRRPYRMQCRRRERGPPPLPDVSLAYPVLRWLEDESDPVMHLETLGDQ